MKEIPYLLFDVFTDVALAGNQLAICPHAELDAATMQRVAREFNLSETVFLRRAEGNAAIASVRIFTPFREMAFAGHPTIGTAIALVDHLRWIGPNENSFVLREGVGDVPIAVDRGIPTTAWLTTPPVTFGRTLSRDDGAAILRVDSGDVRENLEPTIVSAGNPFLFVGLESNDAVDRAVIDESAVRACGLWDEINGVYLFAQTDRGAYARMLAPMSGIAEDPATGSATGPLYALLARRGFLARTERFVNEQGVAAGRRSVLHVRIRWSGDAPEAIEIGGNAVFVGEGRLRV